MSTVTLEKTNFDDVEAEAYTADRRKRWENGSVSHRASRHHKPTLPRRKPMQTAALWLVVVLNTLRAWRPLRRAEAAESTTITSMLVGGMFGPEAGRTAAQREAARYRRQRRQDFLFELRDWLRTIMLCTLCVTFVALCGTLLWMVWR